MVQMKMRRRFSVEEYHRVGEAGVLLVIEVADSSSSHDRNVKLPLYAQAGIPDAWLVGRVRRRLAEDLEPAVDALRSMRCSGATPSSRRWHSRICRSASRRSSAESARPAAGLRYDGSGDLVMTSSSEWRRLERAHSKGARRAELAIEGGAAVRGEMLDPAKGAAYIGDEEKEAVLEVLGSRSLFRYYGPDLQRRVERFEQDLRDLIGVRHAIAVSSGTAALRVALTAMDIGPGDEVVIPAVTFIATFAAVVAQRAVPVIAEVDRSLTLSPADFEAKITPRTRAVIPVHLGNVPCRMDEIMAIARRRRLLVLEDAAQSFGASYRGRRLGSIGDMGAFSLQFEKNITTGEGGAVTTDDFPLFDKAARYQDQGGQFTIQSGDVREHTSGPPIIGENLRMAEITGALAAVQLRRLDGILAAMRENKRRVKGLLSDLPGLEFRETPDPQGDGGSALTFFLDSPDLAVEFAEALRAEGIPAGQVYGGRPVYANPQILARRTAWERGCPFNCAEHPTDVRYFMGMCPRSEDLLRRSVAIGIGPRYEERDCHDIVRAVRKVARGLLSP